MEYRDEQDRRRVVEANSGVPGEKKSQESAKEKDMEQTFEAFFKQNENRMHYHMQKLGIYDTDWKYYMEGLSAMWIAYKKYEPNRGLLATYFNYVIRERLIELRGEKLED
ncbi:hypothetical protein CWR48_03250 [Oceanobacillus arenosus]|uniref:RNA polymerase sigma-70 region 2 domain-containing protein n=1 Tax=Oceanobacillus arenosus TaxID=1229153 RepID=A0A3D8Q068_9BACI|nr:hypothetical protein [Oceanobacillus arenosus]RDW21432.1 hypothetical protein CWR48_03250 [Oceanobacillus arenosus]